MKSIIVKENDVNQRLDNFLVKVFPNVSKTLIFKLVRTKKIKVNKKRTEPDYRLVLNDEISIFYNFDEAKINVEKKDQTWNFLDAKNKIDVVYEDKNLIVVNKPPKLVVHSDLKHEADTLINRVQKYLYLKKEYDPELENQFAPSLVHRIDQNTSGLVVVAKNYLALQTLNEIFKNREIDKRYLALLYGKITPSQQTITIYLKKEDKFVTVYKTKHPEAKESITSYTLLRYLKNKYSLVDVELFTGRTHQIRATFNYLGYPLVGEQKYIKKDIDKDTRFKYQCLCAYKIQFKITDKNNPLFYLNQLTLQIHENDIWFLEKLTSLN